MTYRKQKVEYLEDLKMQIRAILEETKISQAKLALKLNIHPVEFNRFLNKVEQGFSEERLEVLEAWIAKNEEHVEAWLDKQE